MCSCALAWHVHTFDICSLLDAGELADFLLFSLVSQVIDGASEAVFNQAFMLERLDDFRRNKRHPVRVCIRGGRHGAPLPIRPLLPSSVLT